MTRELPGELFLGRNDGMQISVEFSVILPTLSCPCKGIFKHTRMMPAWLQSWSRSW